MTFINKEVAIEYLGGMEAIFDKISKSFLESYKDFKQKVLTSLEEEKESFSDYMTSSLYNEIHSIKGITLNMGMIALYDCTTSILKDLKENIVDTQKIASMLDVFDATYNELKEIIS